MNNEPNPTESRQPKHEAIVEVTDDAGRTVNRTSFMTGAEAEGYASAERAKGHKAIVSSLDPKPKTAI